MTCGDHQDEPTVPSTPAMTDMQEMEVEKQTLTRLVSEGALSTMAESGKRSPQYVSSCEDEEGKPITLSSCDDCKRSGSPMRCVSEFDEVTIASKDAPDSLTSMQDSTNPLCCARLRTAHVRALRLEADLQPMRMILSRLMAHPLNKKGLFNVPVNALALGLVDYHQIIQKPMDLGTIKARLFALRFQSRQEVAEDICLVFQNAIMYNPPRNPVHVAARALQDFFEELFVAIGGDRKSLPASVARPPAQSSACRRVSFIQQPQIKVLQPLAGVSPGKGGKGIMRAVSCDVAPGAGEPSTLPTTDTNQAAPVELCATVNQAQPTASAEGSCLMGSPLSSTRGRGTFASSTPPMEMKHAQKRRLSYSGHKRAPTQGHSCRSCQGRSCLLCEQSCLALEPTLLVCNGANCAGARIRKGSTYFIASDGSRQYCQRCFTCLQPVLSPTAEDETVRYKRDLLKRKNDEELVEAWLTCSKCDMGVHQICALHDSFVHSDDGYTCPGCTPSSPATQLTGGGPTEPRSEMYTFITGSENPLPVSQVSDSMSRLDHDVFSAEALAETDMSAFIEAKVRDRLKSTSRVPNAEKTVTIRIVSDCDRSFNVPEVVRNHFRMATGTDQDGQVVTPPEKVNFKSKAIALFQKVDGLDVCIFCMYVQEYEGDDDYGGNKGPVTDSKKRVYIAYLDSVEHFRPRSARTALYHELLVAYLASARLRGFESAHIWACPPSRGNSFVFWNHPNSQRTPTKDRLISWYHGALSRGIECGVVTDVKSLYESDFHADLKQGSEKENQECSEPLDPSGRMLCPPLLEGDFWIEEAVRIHATSLARHLKSKSPNEGKDLTDICQSPLPEGDPCPARQIGSLLLDRIMAHTSAAPFRRPVNAVALKLKDYHKIVTTPMDLGTVYTRCVHGEYLCLGDLVQDVELVFANAKKFNPDGHFVHTMATEMQELFFQQLDLVTKTWNSSGEQAHCWKSFAKTDMSLDVRIQLPATAASSDSNLAEVKEMTDTMMTDAEQVEDKNCNASAPPSASSPPYEAPGSKTVEGKAKPPSVEELLTGGPDVLSQRMAGEDQWMLEKKHNLPPKKPSVSKKGNGKRRRSNSSVTPLTEDEPSSKRRRQTWVGEEVGASVRSMRTSFFACSLVPASSMSEKEQEKATVYSDYTKCYQPSEAASTTKVIASQIADARSALLEFSQRRNLEFDTLRHAKYSTAVLLYHLHNHGTPGMIPTCTSCKQNITDSRWHKIVKIEELHKAPSKRKKPVKAAAPTESAKDNSKYMPEELCPSCHAKHPQQEQFIPLPVSFPAN